MNINVVAPKVVETVEKPKRGRPSKKLQVEAVNIIEVVEAVEKPKRGRPSKKSQIKAITSIEVIESEPVEAVEIVEQVESIISVEPVEAVKPIQELSKFQQELNAAAKQIFYNKDDFNKVIITNFYDRNEKFECDNIEGYKNHLKTNLGMVELIGGYNQQIKPIFDIDAYNIEPDINELTTDINKIFTDKVVKFAKREPREFKDKGIKYSYRAYVQGVRITSKLLKNLFVEYGLNNNSIYDISIYDKNRVLYLPYTTKKKKFRCSCINSN